MLAKSDRISGPWSGGCTPGSPVVELARGQTAALGAELSAMRTPRRTRAGAGSAHALAPYARIDSAGARRRTTRASGPRTIAAAAHTIGERDAGVAGGRLDDGLPGLELAAPLGVLDDAEREAILDRSPRIGGLELDVELDVRGPSRLMRTTGRAADRLQRCCRKSYVLVMLLIKPDLARAASQHARRIGVRSEMLAGKPPHR